jgi:hypothetical protein
MKGFQGSPKPDHLSHNFTSRSRENKRSEKNGLKFRLLRTKSVYSMFKNTPSTVDVYHSALSLCEIAKKMDVFGRLSVCLALVAGTLLIYSQPWQSEPTELFSWGPPALRPQMKATSNHPGMKWGPPAIRPRAKTRHPIRKDGVTLDLDIKNNKIAAPVTINLFAPGADAAAGAQQSVAQSDMQGNSMLADVSNVAASRAAAAQKMADESREEAVLAAAQQIKAMEAAAEQQQAQQQQLAQQAPKMSAKAVLQQLTDLGKRQEHVLPKFDDSIANMEQLAERERTLQAEVSDLRRSVVTEAGVNRLHEMEQQLVDVRKEILAAPKLLPQRLEQVEKRIASKRTEIERLRGKIYTTEKDLRVADSEDDKGERALEAKVELLRAKQDAIADIMGKPAPKHEPMDALTEGLKIEREINHDKAVLRKLRPEMASAELRLAQLKKDRDEMDADMQEIQNVHEDKARMVMLADEPKNPSSEESKADEPEEESESKGKGEKTPEEIEAEAEDEMQAEAEQGDEGADSDLTDEEKKRRKELAEKGESEKVVAKEPVPLTTFDTVQQKEIETPAEVNKVCMYLCMHVRVYVSMKETFNPAN